jgi:dihydroneopterin aldolase
MASSTTIGVPLAGQIALRGIRASGRHGVFDVERASAQPFLVDVVCSLDLEPAATSDDLANTVDYGRLAAAVVADVEASPVNLLESLAARIADTCLRAPIVDTVSVTVHKPQAPMPVPVADVAVTLVRTRASLPADAPETERRSR